MGHTGQNQVLVNGSTRLPRSLGREFPAADKPTPELYKWLQSSTDIAFYGLVAYFVYAALTQGPHPSLSSPTVTLPVCCLARSPLEPAGTRSGTRAVWWARSMRLLGLAAWSPLEPAGTRGGARAIWWVRSMRLPRCYNLEPAGTRRNPRRNPRFFKDALRRTQISSRTP